MESPDAWGPLPAFRWGVSEEETGRTTPVISAGKWMGVPLRPARPLRKSAPKTIIIGLSGLLALSALVYVVLRCSRLLSPVHESAPITLRLLASGVLQARWRNGRCRIAAAAESLMTFDAPVMMPSTVASRPRAWTVSSEALQAFDFRGFGRMWLVQGQEDKCSSLRVGATLTPLGARAPHHRSAASLLSGLSPLQPREDSDPPFYEFPDVDSPSVRWTAP